MSTASQILETIHMISEHHLDVRTVTMGISLLGCADSDRARACARIEEHIVAQAQDLVRTADEVASEFGVP
ncbi:MAG: DUF711 family protein [Arcanobacterium sp.]|nr:DUF711 family protein [Arcanobacterium sp.]